MSAKPDSPPLNLDEERLSHALVSRGLIAREEAQQCRSTGNTDGGPDALLARLVAAGFLTASQVARASEELSSLMGQQIPGYLLMEKLGQGAMGTVFKARQVSMDRLVAVKVLQPRVAANPDFFQRLTREAHLAARLSHNNIVQAIDVGSAGKIHYFIMEYVEGTTIEKELKGGKVYEEKEAVEIILQIAQALQHAHRRHLIHRDIKPANIILTADRVAKLADLGLARETADPGLAQAEKGMAIGTPFYMAPEQIRGQEDVDGRADIYSLGATLYHMVTGRPPFPGTKVEAVLKAHLHEELVPPDHLNTSLSAGIGEVTECMMAKDRDQRYRNPDDLIIDLEYLLDDEPPRLARKQLTSQALEGLTEGEEDEAEAEPGFSFGKKEFYLWVGLAGAVLGISLLLNLVQLLKR